MGVLHMHILRGWKKQYEGKEDGIWSARYISGDGAKLEIIQPWSYRGAKTAFVSLTVLNRKTTTIFERRTKTDAINKAKEWMKAFPTTEVFRNG